MGKKNRSPEEVPSSSTDNLKYQKLLKQFKQKNNANLAFLLRVFIEQNDIFVQCRGGFTAQIADVSCPLKMDIANHAASI